MNRLNLKQARYNMVEQQIRPWEVLDQRVLDLIETMPRDLFVPAAYKNLAYADIEIPLGQGEVMLSPKMEGRILQAVMPKTSDNVLEIGTGSAYLTAILAKYAQHVCSVDIIEEFTRHAENKLSMAGVNNVSLKTGDAVNGWAEHVPYDVIVLTGSLPVLPDSYRQQLTIGGRLFVVSGEFPIMEACLITRLSDTEWHTEVLFETDLPPLRGALRPQRFTL
jgi:protein-L-isoaspartate(D-aspartate) O-methyltransferase